MHRRLRGDGGFADAAPLSRGAGQRHLGGQRQRPVPRHRPRDFTFAPDARSLFRRGWVGEGRKRRARRACQGASGRDARSLGFREPRARSLRPAGGRARGRRADPRRLADRRRLLPLAARVARRASFWRADGGRLQGDREARGGAVGPRAIRRKWRSPLARSDGPGALSLDDASHDHRRWRRLQWLAPTTVEGGAATTRRRDRPDHPGLPLSAGDLEVEQDHRMFCHITQNWRAMPLVNLLVAIELIANTTTKTGLKIRCELDPNAYPKGIRISEKQMATLNIKRDAFHPEWNYSISPRNPHMKR